MAPRPPAAAAALMDEILEEILLRIPPADPASLLRAALVCKSWGRVVSAAGFRRRFREFHRTAPMLGFFCESTRSCERRRYYSFVSTSSFRAALRDSHQPIDARHGRVLLWNSLCEYGDDGVPLANDLMVWDPTTGWSSELPMPPTSRRTVTWNAAVLCADGACDHLDCARGHFLVVYVCNSKTRMFAHVYSSEAAAWSEEISANMHTLPRIFRQNALYTLPSAFIGNALYFVCSLTVLKYDRAAQELSLIPLARHIGNYMSAGTILRTTEGGQLGLANISSDGVHLYLWSREVGPDGDVGWTQTKVIELRKLLPCVDLSTLRPIGFAHGLNVILVGSSEGTFSIDLKSVRATKVHGEDYCDICFPYMSFYTPALGASSAEGSRTDTSNA